MCNVGQKSNHRSRVEKVKISANPDKLITKFSLRSKKMNTHTFVFLSTNKKVTGIWNFEVGSRKSMETAKDIQFHLWNTAYIFTAVKYSFLYFHSCEIQLFENMHYI